jgi:1-acyl-sn-glycerol-3-phosphate acyltransferase
MKQWLYKIIFFRIMGWKIIGTIAPEIKKCVLMVAPHTSWHEFYLGGFTRGITKIPMHYVAKKELFKFPFSIYFKWMGGIPLDRKGSKDKVEAIAKLYSKYDELRVAIFPEGTRKKVTELKTGFYYIAQKANVPIIPVAFDFSNKEVRIGNAFYTSGNYDVDYKQIIPFFKGVKGQISENGFDFN